LKVKILYLFLLVVLVAACDSQPPVKVLGDDAVIVAFGDSLTFGLGVKKADSYPAVLQTMIKRKVINAGISGEVSADGLERLPDIIEEYAPQLLIICHGGNDILRRQSMVDAENNIRAMVKMAKDQNIDVVLVAVPSMNLSAKPPEFYAAIASDFNIPFEADIIGDLQTDRKMKSDSVHFNEAGYAEIANSIKKVLSKAGALP
jgi:acyl-CoA thioesterase I